LDRFVKTIPAEYKIADEMKKSPKGWTLTLERAGKGAKAPRIIEDTTTAEKTKSSARTPIAKKKKKDLDDLLNIEGGLI